MIKINDFKGVSLVALVITIIVLLILAGITLAFVMGDSGIISKANEAKKKTEISQAEETIKTKIATIQTENEGQADFNTIINEIADDKIEIISNQIIKADIAYDKKYIFTIDDKYNISEAREYSDNPIIKTTPNRVFDNFEE